MSFTEEDIQEFKTEALELLDGAERSLLAADKGASFKSHYDSVFRAFHSIKGAAGMMEMDKLQKHMHRLENILTEHKGKEAVSGAHVEFFLRGTDAARQLLDGRPVEFAYEVGIPPATPSERPSPKPSPQTSTSATSGKVVVVDDEPEIVDIVTKILCDAGMEVQGTTQPEEVAKILATTPTDVVVSDIAMPKLDGVRLLEELASSHPDLPVIFLSGHVTKDILVNAINSGVYSVIEKPFDATRLIESCVNAIRRRQLMRMFNTSLNLLLYQLPDLTAFLKATGKEDVRIALDREIGALLDQRRQFRKLRR